MQSYANAPHTALALRALAKMGLLSRCRATMPAYVSWMPSRLCASMLGWGDGSSQASALDRDSICTHRSPPTHLDVRRGRRLHRRARRWLLPALAPRARAALAADGDLALLLLRPGRRARLGLLLLLAALCLGEWWVVGQTILNIVIGRLRSAPSHLAALGRGGVDDGLPQRLHVRLESRRHGRQAAVP